MIEREPHDQLRYQYVDIAAVLLTNRCDVKNQ